MRLLAAATLLVLVTNSRTAPVPSPTSSPAPHSNVVLLDSFVYGGQAVIQAYTYRDYSSIMAKVVTGVVNKIAPRLRLFATKPLHTSLSILIGAQEFEIESSGMTSKTINIHQGNHQSDRLTVTVKGNSEINATLYASPDRGYAIISDIDDTVKVSNVLSGVKVAYNTVVGAPRPIQKMPELYQALDKYLSRPLFVYISGSPFPLYPFLRDFLSKFFSKTLGPIILQNIPPTDFSWLSSKPTAIKEYKLKKIKGVMTMYPNKRLYLIGDSGQLDPETYAEVYREHPGKVQCIMIRKIPDQGANNSKERFSEVFGKVNSSDYKLFTDKELPGLIKAVQKGGTQRNGCPVPETRSGLSGLGAKLYRLTHNIFSGWMG